MRRSDPPSMNRKSLALAHFSMSWIAAAPNMGRIVGRKPFAIAGVLPAGPMQAMVGICCLPPQGFQAISTFRVECLLRLRCGFFCRMIVSSLPILWAYLIAARR